MLLVSVSGITALNSKYISLFAVGFTCSISTFSFDNVDFSITNRFSSQVMRYLKARLCGTSKRAEHHNSIISGMLKASWYQQDRLQVL